MEDTQTEQNKNGFFSDLSWKTALLIAGIGFVSGGTSGGVVATKGVQAAPNALTEEKADVRYLSKAEAERRIESRDKQLESIRQEMMKQQVFDAYQKNNVERMDRMERMMQQMLENQNRYRP